MYRFPSLQRGCFLPNRVWERHGRAPSGKKLNPPPSLTDAKTPRHMGRINAFNFLQESAGGNVVMSVASRKNCPYNDVAHFKSSFIFLVLQRVKRNRNLMSEVLFLFHLAANKKPLVARCRPIVLLDHIFINLLSTK